MFFWRAKERVRQKKKKRGRRRGSASDVQPGCHSQIEKLDVDDATFKFC
jgi:hypothetical protein